MWQIIHLNYKTLCGCIVIGAWFFFIPASLHDSLFSGLHTFINIPLSFLEGIVDLSILLGVCFLCGYPFQADKITVAGIRKQIEAAIYFLVFFFCVHCPLLRIHGCIRKLCHSCILWYIRYYA